MCDYDKDPVFYCDDCHSLCIVGDARVGDWDGLYCEKCGSTNIKQCSIGDWLEEEKRNRGGENDN